MKKLICALFVVLATVLVLGACGTEQASPVSTISSQPTAASAPLVTPTASSATPGAAATRVSSEGQKGEIIVSAAISLSDALKEIKTAFEAENAGATVTYNLGASGSLQLQIEQGAPADVFLSAGQNQVDTLENKGLLLSDTRRNIAANSLVLIVPKGSALGITKLADLTKPEVKRVAIGNPDTVPAGEYAKESLTKLDLWDGLQPKLILAENVRQVLTYVERGETDAGLVYSSDAKTSSDVTVVAEAPTGSHKPILYPGAVVKDSKRPDLAKQFLDYLSGPQGQAILQKYGFKSPQ